MDSIVNFYNKFCSQNIKIIDQIMKTVDSNHKMKHFHHAIRPSQSLHSKFMKTSIKDQSSINGGGMGLQEITICIIFKKKKIQFQIKNKTSFKELNKLLYFNLFKHLLEEHQQNPEKAERIIKTIVGFQSIDGDINFDYRLSLQKGCIEKTKFFHVFCKRSNSQSVFNYKIYNCLAIGGFSKVYLSRSYENGHFYAIKFIRKQRSKNGGQHDKEKYQSMKNEIQVCQSLEHPFLVKLMHSFQTDHFYCMVFEYCPGGQLFFLLKKVKIMSENMARFYFLQILYGIQYLHSKQIIYRDLKPENILIDADGNCKIVDFGLSKRIQSRSKTYSYCGSAEYMAPEMILRTGHSFGIDYYSLGALLFELVTGLPPYYTKNHDQLQQSIICKDLTFPSHIQLSTQIKDLLQKLLKKEEKYRLGSYVGIKQILFHPWIGKVKSALILNKEIKSPYLPNLLDYNFDVSQLGDDEEQFTALVYEDASKKNSLLREYFKRSQLTINSNQILNHIIEEEHQACKQNTLSFKTQPISSIKRNLSKQRLRQFFKPQRANILQRIDKHPSREKPKVNESIQSKRSKEISRLSPYLSYKRASPKKQKQLIDFIQHKIMRVERGGASRTLKRMKIQKNRIQIDR